MLFLSQKLVKGNERRGKERTVQDRIGHDRTAERTGEDRGQDRGRRTGQDRVEDRTGQSRRPWTVLA